MEDRLAPLHPDGFGQFWADLIGEAESRSLVYDLLDQDEQHPPHHTVKRFEMESMSGDTIHGWLALPEEREGKSPGFLWLPPYSRWSMLPNEYGARKGYASISLNYFGETAFHQEKYTPERGYFAQGIEHPETWIFGDMIQNAILAGRILATNQAVDNGRIGATGMSQGGGMAIWLGAMWSPIKAVVADMPFLGGMRKILNEDRPFRYPLKELTDVMQSSEEINESVQRTVSFYDTVNMAAMCDVPTRVTLGLKDPAVRPEQARAVEEALAGTSELEELDWGHDWHPRMIEGGQAWFDRYL